VATLTPALIEEYNSLYRTMEISSEHLGDADQIINKIVDKKVKYKTIERSTNVPWFVIAAIHSLESSLNFNTHLHNGDPLTGKTVNVPRGRIPGKNPPYNWDESAIDSLQFDNVDSWTDWSLAGTCFTLEKYNGWGYREYHPEVKSPYLWSFSNHYTKGKYAADGIFKSDLVSEQCGGMVLLKRMEQRGLIALGGNNSVIPEHQPVSWLELYRKEERDAAFPVLAAWAESELIEVIELKERSTDELASFCGKYPTAKTFHVARSDKAVPPPKSGMILPPSSNLPTLTRILRWGDKGEDVKALQKVLNKIGLNAGAEDGEFEDQTEGAVKAFQLRASLLVDGEVGPITWQALGGGFDDMNIIPDGDPLHLKLAAFASKEAAKGLRWNGSSSEAEKYLRIFRPIMQDLGHIGSVPEFYNWCAAYVTYCCRQVGINIPDKPDGFWASMALVESWRYWAKQQGFWNPPGTTKPTRGDIVTFDWPNKDGEFNHIGVVRGYTPGSSMVETAEGNADNLTAHKIRRLSSLSGIIRIR
jgi:lysozyme family protein